MTVSLHATAVERGLFEITRRATLRLRNIPIHELATKERVSKQKLSKGCHHQGQNIIVLAILEHLEFENFSCWPTMVVDNTFQCSMTLHATPHPLALPIDFEIHFAGPAPTINYIFIIMKTEKNFK